jgi:hypothetical protein
MARQADCPAPHNKKSHCKSGRGYADNTFLPFWRRRANTLRPLLVLMRLRKPWTRARWRFFGWNVRFIQLHLLFQISGLVSRVSKRRSLQTYFGSITHISKLINDKILLKKISYPHIFKNNPQRCVIRPSVDKLSTAFYRTFPQVNTCY